MFGQPVNSDSSTMLHDFYSFSYIRTFSIVLYLQNYLYFLLTRYWWLTAALHVHTHIGLFYILISFHEIILYPHSIHVSRDSQLCTRNLPNMYLVQPYILRFPLRFVSSSTNVAIHSKSSIFYSHRGCCCSCLLINKFAFIWVGYFRIIGLKRHLSK